ncbi:MAG: hypothetical protein ACYDCK_04475 [Thermoplasmatota archaeon]
MPHSRIAFALATLAFVGVSSAAFAQDSTNSTTNAPATSEHGETNDLGSISMQYETLMNGTALPIDASVALRNTTFGDEQVTYVMFSFNTSGTPLVAKFDSLATANGTDIAVTKKASLPNEEHWFADIHDLPKETPVLMRGTLDATDRGLYRVSAVVVVFNYRWEPLKLANGSTASLYSFTQVGVNKESLAQPLEPASTGATSRHIPAAGALAGVGLAASVALVARRRVKR